MSREGVMGTSIASILVGLVLLLTANAGAEQPSSADVEFFEKHVRPILVNHCHECHSGTAKKLQAGLRLDSRPHMLRGGDSGPAITVGQANNSLLIEAVRYESFEMPPRGKLPDQDIHNLVRWIDQGAVWPEELPTDRAAEAGGTSEPFPWRQRMQQHWAFQPLNDNPPPMDSDGGDNEIDAFIRDRLRLAEIEPAAEADWRSLVRRVYFDLTGLPPTPDEVEAFGRDHSDAAYTALVDRLLAKPEFGEKWARHWLDLVRYAETYGHEYDYPIPYAYQYRDYLIRALNADVSYLQLMKEHLAGDLLDSPRLNPKTGLNESILGTGFWLLGEATHGPTDVVEDEATRIDNQIDVMSKSFLGLSVACARCHDHKFDPISTEDYYALKGVLQSSRYQIAELVPESQRASIEQSVVRLRNQACDLVRQSVVSSPLTAEDVAEYLLNEYRPQGDLSQQGSPLDLWHAVTQPSNEPPTGSLATADVSQRYSEVLQAAQRRFQNESDRWIEWSAQAKRIGDFAESADWLMTGSGIGIQSVTATEAYHLGSHFGIVGRTGFAAGILGNRVVGSIQSRTFRLKDGFVRLRLRAKNVTVRLICHNYQLEPQNGLLFNNTRLSGDQLGDGESFCWVRLGHELRAGDEAYLEWTVGEGGYLICDAAYLDESDPSTPPPVVDRDLGELAYLTQPTTHSREDLALRYGAYWKVVQRAWTSGTVNASQARFADWLFAQGLLIPSRGTEAFVEQRDELNEAMSKTHRVLAVCDGTGLDASVAIRGNTHNCGAVVPRRLPLAIGGEEQPTVRSGSGRLELACRLADPDNVHPLVPRVAVNRIWSYLFGEGIVPSLDDFGAMGQRPSYPELLDWLAIDFMNHGWSCKHLIRLLVSSRTYRMSTRSPDPSAVERDPNNRLLYQMRVRRLGSEAIRDQILSVAGTLRSEFGGESVPIYLSDFMQGRGRPEQGPLDGAGRRTIYVSVRRNFLSQDSLAFDFPIPTTTVGRRSTSNVPAQSLVLLNSPFVTEQARRWAKALTEEYPDDVGGRLQAMYLAAFARPATDEQFQFCLAFIAKQNAAYGHIDDLDLQVWTDLCQVMFNLKEFIYLN